MRKFLVLVMCVALLGACKSDSKDDKVDTSSGSSDSSSGIRAKILTEADLPSGFKRTSLDVDERTPGETGCAQLDQVDVQYAPKTEHTVEAAFQNGDDETATQFLDESVWTFKTVDEANAYYDAEVAGINGCKTFTTTDENGTMTGQIQPIAFAALGEESTAVSITQTQGGSSIGGSAVIVRKGNAFIGFSAIHVGNEPGLTASDLEAIMRKAVDKL
jgi:hypothetical protein